MTSLDAMIRTFRDHPTVKSRQHNANHIPAITLDILNGTASDKSFHDGTPPEGQIATSQFEYLILLCERRFGKEATWNRIKEIIFEINDKYLQECILEYCGYRNDSETDLQRYGILVDFIKDNKFPVYQKIIAIDKLSECNKSEIDALKELYAVVNDETRQYLSFEIIYSDLRNKGFREVNRITRAVCDINIDESSRDGIVTVTKKLMPRFGRDNVLDVLGEILKHKFATDATKGIVRRVLENASR